MHWPDTFGIPKHEVFFSFERRNYILQIFCAIKLQFLWSQEINRFHKIDIIYMKIKIVNVINWENN